jgi:hypothetical protein
MVCVLTNHSFAPLREMYFKITFYAQKLFKNRLTKPVEKKGFFPAEYHGSGYWHNLLPLDIPVCGF